MDEPGLQSDRNRLIVGISTFRNALDNRPISLDVPWLQLTQLLASHEERNAKDGLIWSPSRYPTGATRANQHVIEVTAAVGDFDSGLTWQDFEKHLKPYEARLAGADEPHSMVCTSRALRSAVLLGEAAQ